MGHAADEKPLPLGGFHKLRYARFNGLRHQVEIPRKRAYLVLRIHIGPHGIIAARDLPRRFCKGGQRPCAPVHDERDAARAQKYACEAYGGERPRQAYDAVIGRGDVLHHVHGVGCVSHRYKAARNKHIAPVYFPLRDLHRIFVFGQRQKRARIDRNAGIERFIPAHQYG